MTYLHNNKRIHLRGLGGDLEELMFKIIVGIIFIKVKNIDVCIKSKSEIG